MVKVDNAIIMAAGTSSRFAPLSYETHKGLIKVKNEILVERQIRQLKEAGIHEIIIVTGYKAEQFSYLQDKFQVKLIHNPEYLTRNNNGSIYAVRNELKNSYICSVDNYFTINPFASEVDESYYAALFAQGKTKEWCMQEDTNGYINHVSIGGENAWYMLGHTFWNQSFSQTFLKILENIYDEKSTKDMLWEKIFMQHLDVLKMRIQRYHSTDIFEFDTLDELREFDSTYINHSGSQILQSVSKSFGVSEKEITNIQTVKGTTTAAIGFTFDVGGKSYIYHYDQGTYQEKEVTL